MINSKTRINRTNRVNLVDLQMKIKLNKMTLIKIIRETPAKILNKISSSEPSVMKKMNLETLVLESQWHPKVQVNSSRVALSFRDSH